MTGWLIARTRRRLTRLVSPYRLVGLLGDLQEDFARRRGAHGPLRAHWWLWREARSLERAYGAAPEGSHMGLRWLATDLVLASRRWRRRPGVPATMVVTLALGIAATTAIFSVVDAVLLRPLPWPEADRLVVIHGVEPERLQRPARAATWNRALLTWQDWERLQATGVYQHVAAWWPQTFVLYSDAGTEMLSGMYASANLLDTVGAPPLLGRMFTPGDDRTMNVNEVLISARLWQRHFGTRPDILNRPLVAGPGGGGSRGEPYRIIGVLPAGLRFNDDQPDLVFSVGWMSHNLSFGAAQLRLLGRLAPGRTIDVAQAAAAAQIGATDLSPTRTARVVHLDGDEIGQAARPLWLLFGGASLLLLVSCANVAGLLLGEVRARRHEIAVRTSLGSGFGRILRQLTVEQVALSVLASAAGVLLAVWLLPPLVALAPDRLPRLDEVRIDLRLAGLALGLGTITALLFALVPTWTLARTPAAMVLAEGSRDGAGGRHAGQRVIVAAEVALAMVLVVGATLFGETILRLSGRALGFTSDRLIVISLNETGRAYNEEEWGSVLNVRAGNAPARMAPRGPDGRELTRDDIRRIMEAQMLSSVRRDAITKALTAIPGITAVAGVTQAPFVATPMDAQVQVPGIDEPVIASRVAVTGDYFGALGLPIAAGKAFDVDLSPRARQVALSNHLSRRLFGQESPVGRQVAIGATAATRQVYDVVAVAADAKHQSLTEDDRPMIYVANPSGQLIGGRDVAQYLARTAVDPGPLLPRVRDALRNTNPPLAVTTVTTMDELVAGTVAEPRFRATLAVVFGAAALLLSAVGLFALTSRRVEERRREIGVRVALGARGLDIRRLVFSDAARTWLLGLAVGLPAAVLLSELTQALLFGVSATSPRVYAVAAAVLAVAAIAAVLVPVRRAARVDVASLLKL